MGRGDYYLLNRAGNSTGLAATYIGITNAGNDGYVQIGPGLESLDLTGLPVGANVMRTTYQGIDFLGRPFRLYDGQLTRRLQVDSTGAAVTGVLGVSGNTTLSGKAVVTDSLRVGRITTLNGGLTVQGAGVTFNNPLSFSTTAGNGISFNGATGGATITNASDAKLQLGGRNNSTTLVLNGNGSSDATVNGNLIVTDSLRANAGIYVGGQFVSKILTTTATLDFNLATGVQDLTVTINGAEANDDVVLGLPAGIFSCVNCETSLYIGWVSAANTVTIRGYGVSVPNPPSSTFRVTVIKH